MFGYSILFLLMFRDLIPKEFYIEWNTLYSDIRTSINENKTNINEILNNEFYKTKMSEIVVSFGTMQYIISNFKAEKMS